MLRSVLRKLMSSDLAIDLGTAFTRVFSAGSGVTTEKPSILEGVDTSHSHPVRSGVIADRGAAAELIESVMVRTAGRSLRPPRVLACVPSDATVEEERALRQAVRAGGASDIAIIQEPLAAAVGAGLDMSSEYAQLLVDFGEGVTDAAVIRSGQLIITRGIRVGCGDLRQAMEDGIAAQFDLSIGEDEAEALVRAGCGRPWTETMRLSDSGVVVSRDALLEICRPVLERIAEFVSRFFFDLPDSVAAEVVETGLVATGGGALHPRLIELLSLETGLLVRPADDPLHSVIRGAGNIVSAPSWHRLLKAQ